MSLSGAVAWGTVSLETVARGVVGLGGCGSGGLWPQEDFAGCLGWKQEPADMCFHQEMAPKQHFMS